MYYSYKLVKLLLTTFVFLQFDGRIEGFEKYIESVFGPGGIYQQKEVNAVLESLRPKRKVGTSKLNSGKLQMLDEQFDAGSRFTDEPEVSAFNPIFFLSKI